MYLHQLSPIALKLPFWPHAIHWYGIMYLLGFAVAYYLGSRRLRAGHLPGVSQDSFSDLLFYAMIGVVLGGRVGYLLFYIWPEFSSNPLMFFKINEGGMSFHGGLLGVMLAVAIWSWKNKLHIFDSIDFIAPLVPFGLAFGRFGNFINGELWGKITTQPWGVIFPASLPMPYSDMSQAQILALHANGQLDEFARHPSQLYQMGLEGIVLLVPLYVLTHKPRARYLASGVFALLYGIGRFAVEFVREPDQQMGYLALNWLTMGQLLSIPLIVIGVVFIWMSRTAPSLRASD
jgi:phosphatidylglycerol---prolipoprotein diacylglyceryl transferase